MKISQVLLLFLHYVIIRKTVLGETKISLKTALFGKTSGNNDSLE